MKMIKASKRLWEQHPEWHDKCRQFLRFGIVGTGSSAIHYGAYCLVLLIANANIAFTAGYGVGFVCNYFLTTFFTFRARPSSKNVAGFGMSHVVNYLLEIGLLNLFLWLECSELLAPILVMIIVIPINFVLLRLVYTYKMKRLL